MSIWACTHTHIITLPSCWCVVCKASSSRRLPFAHTHDARSSRKEVNARSAHTQTRIDKAACFAKANTIFIQTSIIQRVCAYCSINNVLSGGVHTFETFSYEPCVRACRADNVGKTSLCTTRLIVCVCVCTCHGRMHGPGYCLAKRTHAPQISAHRSHAEPRPTALASRLRASHHVLCLCRFCSKRGRDCARVRSHTHTDSQKCAETSRFCSRICSPNEREAGANVCARCGIAQHRHRGAEAHVQHI